MKQRLSSFGFILKDTDIDDKSFSELEKFGLELENIYNSAVSKSKGIDGNDSFTSKGKLLEKKKLVSEVSQQLEKFRRIAHDEYEVHGGTSSISLEIRKLKESMQKPFDTKVDPVLQFLKEQEIRNLLRQVGDPLKTETMIRRKENFYLESYLLLQSSRLTLGKNARWKVLRKQKLPGCFFW